MLYRYIFFVFLCMSTMYSLLLQSTTSSFHIIIEKIVRMQYKMYNTIQLFVDIVWLLGMLVGLSSTTSSLLPHQSYPPTSLRHRHRPQACLSHT